MTVADPPNRFREFLRTVARGPSLSRALDAAEAEVKRIDRELDKLDTSKNLSFAV
mgnify:CR=1 FL=1